MSRDSAPKAFGSTFPKILNPARFKSDCEDNTAKCCDTLWTNPPSISHSNHSAVSEVERNDLFWLVCQRSSGPWHMTIASVTFWWSLSSCTSTDATKKLGQ